MRGGAARFTGIACAAMCRAGGSAMRQCNSPIDSIRRHQSTATKTFAVTDSPPVFVSGAGALLLDEGGRRYIDMASGSSSAALGYGHPAIAEAVKRQLDTGILHIGPHFHAPIQAELYEALLALAPPHLARVHPATNGTEAVEVALKAAQTATGARTFVSFQGAYHGRTAGALAVSTTAATRAALAPLLPAAQFFPYPCCSRCSARPAEGCCGFAERALAEAADNPASGLPPLAGVIVEAVQGTGGVIVPPPSFLQAVQRFARAKRVPLIVDEIFTGLGRTGAWFAFARAGIEPDLVVLAKSAGGGLPLGAVLGREELLGRWSPGMQSSTFQAHPLAAAAAVAGIRALREQRLVERAIEIEAWFRAAYTRLSACKLVGDCRGIGALHGIEIVDPSSSKPDRDRCSAVRKSCLENGLITYECGWHGNVIGLLPPLVIAQAEVSEGLAILQAALDAQS